LVLIELSGAVGGPLSIIGWTLLNTYCGVVLGDLGTTTKTVITLLI